jgi:7-cyano-7-deazaguanine synthase in queuosine biosynthesis
MDYPERLYFRMRHRYQYAEEQALERIDEMGLSEIDVVTSNALTDLGDMEKGDAYIPLRNLLFVCWAALYGYDRVILGATAGETVRDKSWRFMGITGKLLSFLLGRKIVIDAPYKRTTKTELVRQYLDRFASDLDIKYLWKTVSCYWANDYPQDNDEENPGQLTGCGQCMACARRWVAMTNNDLEELYDDKPINYWTQRIDDETVINHIKRYISERFDLLELPWVIRNQNDMMTAVRKAID